jgi:hypothetical protein
VDNVELGRSFAVGAASNKQQKKRRHPMPADLPSILAIIRGHSEDIDSETASPESDIQIRILDAARRAQSVGRDVERESARDITVPKSR